MKEPNAKDLIIYEFKDLKSLLDDFVNWIELNNKHPRYIAMEKKAYKEYVSLTNFNREGVKFLGINVVLLSIYYGEKINEK